MVTVKEMKWWLEHLPPEAQSEVCSEYSTYWDALDVKRLRARVPEKIIGASEYMDAPTPTTNHTLLDPADIERPSGGA